MASGVKAGSNNVFAPRCLGGSVVIGGEVVNSIAVAGILAAHAVTTGVAQPRPVDSPWIDKPTAFAARKAAR